MGNLGERLVAECSSYHKNARRLQQEAVHSSIGGREFDSIQGAFRFIFLVLRPVHRR